MKIDSVNIVGTGNVASFLAHSLSNKIQVKSVWGRNSNSAIQLADEVGAKAIKEIENLETADLTIIAVSDDAITEVASKLSADHVVVHTSGSVSIEVLSKFSNNGILYPLQTISKEREVDVNEIPFLIEASSQSLEKTLIGFCKGNLSENAIVTDSKSRATIHLAAVFVNNFTNHLFVEAEQILSSIDQGLSILHPLMKETVEKAIELGALNAQTGPAKRNDEKIMRSHLEKLNDQQLKELYKVISSLIAKKQANT